MRATKPARISPAVTPTAIVAPRLHWIPSMCASLLAGYVAGDCLTRGQHLIRDLRVCPQVSDDQAAHYEREERERPSHACLPRPAPARARWPAAVWRRCPPPRWPLPP